MKEIDRSHLTTFNTKFKHYGTRSIRIDRPSTEENVGPDAHFSLIFDSPCVINPPSSAVHDMGSASKRRKFSPTLEQMSRDHHGQPLQANGVGSIHIQQTQNVQPPIVHDGFVAGACPNHPQGRSQQQLCTAQEGSSPLNYYGSAGNYPPHANPTHTLHQHIQ